MNYLMVDISGKVINYDIALCEAMAKEMSPQNHLILLAANIPPQKIECESRCLLSLIPKSFQNSENKIKRGIKAIEAVLNYCFLILLLLFKKTDILHLQWLPFLEVSSIEKIFLCFLHIVSPKTKFLLTVHNIYPHNCSEKGKIAYRKRFTKIERYFDKFILHLQTSKDEFCKEFEIDEHRATVIPHGVFVPKNLKVIPHKRGEKLNLIMYGSQSYYKGTDILVDAIALLPLEMQKKVHTLIVGKTAPDYLKNLKAKANGLDIEFIPEYVSDDFLNKKIMESDVIVLPYRQISQSGVLLLALNFERMIIASDLPSFRETLAGMNDDVFFERENVESLKNLIELYVDEKIDDTSILKQCSQLQEVYSWTQVAKKYKQFF